MKVFKTQEKWDEHLSVRQGVSSVSVTVHKPRHYAYSIGLDMDEVRALRDALTAMLEPQS